MFGYGFQLMFFRFIKQTHLLIVIKDLLCGIPLMILIKNKFIAKFLNRKLRHSFLKLTIENRFPQNFKRYCKALVFASRWLIIFNNFFFNRKNISKLLYMGLQTQLAFTTTEVLALKLFHFKQCNVKSQKRL